MRRRTKSQPDSVYQITGVRRGITEDVNARQRRYVMSMGVRTVCFILAVVTHGWWQAVFLVGAIVLPYVAVVFANGGRERAAQMPAVPLDERLPALPAARSKPPQ